jgi:hypothetical protein
MDILFKINLRRIKDGINVYSYTSEQGRTTAGSRTIRLSV